MDMEIVGKQFSFCEQLHSNVTPHTQGAVIVGKWREEAAVAQCPGHLT